MSRRSYSGGAQSTTVAAAITSIATNGQVGSTTGWPDGSGGPFAIAINRGQGTEEKILVASRVGTTLTFTSRGYDGTTAQSHSPGEPVELVLTSTDLDEANAHVNATTGVHGLVAGQKVVGDIATQTLSGKTMDGGSNVFTNIAQSSVVGLVVQLAAMVADTATRLTQATGDLRYLKLIGGVLTGSVEATQVISQGDFTAKANVGGFFGRFLSLSGDVNANNAFLTGAVTSASVATGSVNATSGITTAGSASVGGDTATTTLSVSGASSLGSVVAGSVIVGTFPVRLTRMNNAFTRITATSGSVGVVQGTLINTSATVDVSSAVEVEFSWYGLDPTAAGDRFDISIYAGSTQVATCGIQATVTGAGGGSILALLPAGTVSGVINFSGRIQRVSGTGTTTILAGTVNPMVLIVKQF